MWVQDRFGSQRMDLSETTPLSLGQWPQQEFRSGDAESASKLKEINDIEASLRKLKLGNI